MDFNQIIQDFQAAMLSHGITAPRYIVADGQLHRFYVQGDKCGSKNGWYSLFMDKIPCGVYGNWKTGNSYKWYAKKCEHMHSSEYALFQKQILEAKLKRDELRAKEQAEAAKKANFIYHNSSAANLNHLYIVNKRIKPFCAHQKGNNLVLPIINIDGKFQSLQYITPKGDKWFLPNGAIKGNFIPIQKYSTEKTRILICEGFATGATLANIYPESCVIAACNAKNLKQVAINVRIHLPQVEILIAADIDQAGLVNAREAALAVKAKVIKPSFPSGASKKLSDFNDLFCWLALGEFAA